MLDRGPSSKCSTCALVNMRCWVCPAWRAAQATICLWSLVILLNIFSNSRAHTTNEMLANQHLKCDWIADRRARILCPRDAVGAEHASPFKSFCPPKGAMLCNIDLAADHLHHSSADSFRMLSWCYVTHFEASSSSVQEIPSRPGFLIVCSCSGVHLIVPSKESCRKISTKLFNCGIHLTTAQTFLVTLLACTLLLSFSMNSTFRADAVIAPRQMTDKQVRHDIGGRVLQALHDTLMEVLLNNLATCHRPHQPRADTRCCPRLSAWHKLTFHRVIAPLSSPEQMQRLRSRSLASSWRLKNYSCQSASGHPRISMVSWPR